MGPRRQREKGERARAGAVDGWAPPHRDRKRGARADAGRRAGRRCWAKAKPSWAYAHAKERERDGRGNGPPAAQGQTPGVGKRRKAWASFWS